MKLIQVGIDLRRFLRDLADSFDDLSDLAHGTLRVWTRSVAASIAWTAETRVPLRICAGKRDVFPALRSTGSLPVIWS